MTQTIAKTAARPSGIAAFRWNAYLSNEKASRFWSFSKARAYVRKLNLTGQTQWFMYVKTGLKPPQIPSNPNVVYAEWKGYGDWVGNGSQRATRYREFKSFQEVRKFVKPLQLKNSTQWEVYCRSGFRPFDIPANPRSIYFNNWISWEHFLGSK